MSKYDRMMIAARAMQSLIRVYYGTSYFPCDDERPSQTISKLIADDAVIFADALIERLEQPDKTE